MVPVKSYVWNQYSGMGYRLSSDMQVEGLTTQGYSAENCCSGCIYSEAAFNTLRILEINDNARLYH